MVARGLERVLDALQHALPVVDDAAGLAVHQPRGTGDLSAEGCPDTLVSEAYPEGGDARAHLLEHPLADAEVVLVRGMPGAWGDYYAVGGHVAHLVQGDLVVPEDLRCASQLPDVLGEVVHERVVVVDDQDIHLLFHPWSLCGGPSLGSSRGCPCLADARPCRA